MGPICLCHTEKYYVQRSESEAVLENEWNTVYLCVSLDDSCSFTLCYIVVSIPLIVACVTIWFHSCVGFEQQYTLDLYTLCCQLCTYMESFRVMVEWKNEVVGYGFRDCV